MCIKCVAGLLITEGQTSVSLPLFLVHSPTPRSLGSSNEPSSKSIIGCKCNSRKTERLAVLKSLLLFNHVSAGQDCIRDGDQKGELERNLRQVTDFGQHQARLLSQVPFKDPWPSEELSGQFYLCLFKAVTKAGALHLRWASSTCLQAKMGSYINVRKRRGSWLEGSSVSF